MHSHRITIFSNFFWPQGAGADAATYAALKVMLREHFEVVVVSGTDSPCIPSHPRLQYFHWRWLEEKPKPLEWAGLFANAATIGKLIEQSEIVYIPSHSLIPLAIIARSIKPRARIVVHLHGYQPVSYNAAVLPNSRRMNADQILFELRDHNSVARALLTGLIMPINYINVLALMLADKVIFVSRRQMDITSGHLPWIRDRAMIVPNIPPETYYPEKNPSDTPTFLYVGGSSLLKGLRLVLKAGLTLSKDDPRLRIVITNYLSDQAKKLITELNRKRKTFEPMGRVARKDLLHILSETWSLLFPSLWEEPWPYAVMETMLSGSIPITSRVGGTPELVEGTAAEKYLFDPGNAEEFVDRIESILALSKENLIHIGQTLREQTLKRLDTENSKKILLEALTN